MRNPVYALLFVALLWFSGCAEQQSPEDIDTEALIASMYADADALVFDAIDELLADVRITKEEADRRKVEWKRMSPTPHHHECGQPRGQ